MNPDQKRLAELIAGAKEKLAAQTTAAPQTAPTLLQQAIAAAPHPEFDSWEWNEEQQQAITKATNRESFNLIGAAGTGKTTTLREILKLLISRNLVKPIDISTKYLQRGLPGVALTSFTRRAVRNIRKVVSDDVKPHCITIHKLLEFEPVFYEVWDEEAGKNRVTMRFEPARNAQKPLPHSLVTIVIDEASMPSTLLWKQLVDALPESAKVQFIFVGDLHQLPPVYGQAILGFKLLELPTVELKKIYRQAQHSPIITLAHKIKNGDKIPVTERTVVETEQGKVTIHPWKKPLSDYDATHTMGIFLRKLASEGDYNEEEDIILCPQEKTKNLAFGTNEFNKVIAQTLGDKRKAVVHEVIAGFQRHYFAVGDRIMVGREDATIVEIRKNPRYWSTVRPRPASEHLDRWGNYKQKPTATEDDGADFDVDKYLDSFTLKGEEQEDKKQEASHIIKVELLDTEQAEELSSAGDINALLFAYCLTVHKAQGSEWNRVFFLTHQSHVTMWSRELLYTAVTRARKELYMIVEPDRGGKDGTLTKAARSPRIKGDTLAEKAEYFKGKQDEFNDMMSRGADKPKGKIVEGRYKGDVQDKKPVIPVSSAPPIKLVRLCELLPADFIAEANKKLDERWEVAKGIWGDRIGSRPSLDFNLQRSKTVGLAVLGSQQIKLNPLWCLIGLENPSVKEEMLGDTLDHEIAHIVAWNFSTDRGHDSGWRMAMKLLGRVPNVTVSDNALPSWARSFEHIMQQKQEALKGVAVTTDDYILGTTDEV